MNYCLVYLLLLLIQKINEQEKFTSDLWSIIFKYYFLDERNKLVIDILIILLSFSIILNFWLYFILKI